MTEARHTVPSDLPFAPACERNRDPILQILRAYLMRSQRVLEIGSGTGQHAVYFASALPHLEWQTSEVAENLPGIRAWLAHAGLPNTPAPLTIDVAQDLQAAAGGQQFDALFTANTLHIMAWTQVQQFFRALPYVMAPDALLLVYGPFNYNNAFTSPGNEQFDATLRQADPLRGIRDFAAVNALALAAGLTLVQDHAMPANNRCLVWRNGAAAALGTAQASALANTPLAHPAPAAFDAGIQPPASRTDLFVSFTLLALQGFGGVLAVVQREVVDKKRWMTRETFVEEWAVAQVLPGPNVLNLSLMIGARYFGVSGALAAMAGMVLLPLLIVLGMAFAYVSLASQPWMASALRGMGAAAAGLIAASSIKLMPALWHSVLGARNCKALMAVTFFAVAWGRLPLLWVVIGLGLPACLLAWRKLIAADAETSA